MVRETPDAAFRSSDELILRLIELVDDSNYDPENELSQKALAEMLEIDVA